MTNTTPFPAFQELLEAMRQQSADAATNLEGGDTARPWMMPPLRDWDGNLLDIAGIAKAFARDEPNEDYKDSLNTDAGTVGHAMGAKLQIDYMAMMERAFRTRHATVARCTTHAAGRRRAHGEPAGIHIGSVLQYAQDLLRSGGGSGN